MLEKVLKEFFILLSELTILFLGISFFVAFLQNKLSNDRLKKILSRGNTVINSLIGATIGLITPFCTCSTIPLLIGLFKSNAPFGGAMSFLFASPLLNPAVVILFITFFGPKATIIYVSIIFGFSVIAGILLEKLGFRKYIRPIAAPKACCSGCGCDNHSVESPSIMKSSILSSFDMLKKIFPFLLLVATIGALIQGFLPDNYLSILSSGYNEFISVPMAAILGIPMYIRTETMIPIGLFLAKKGLGMGTIIALLIGGAGLSVPELVLLNTIFKKKLAFTIILCIFTVAVGSGIIFNILY